MQVFSSLLFRKKPCEKISVFCLNSNRHARLEMKVNYATQRRLSTAQTRINQKTQKTNVKQLTNGDGKYNATINDAAESLSIVCVCKCTWFLFRGIRDVVHVIRQKKLDPSLLWKLLHTVQVLVSVFSVFFADIPYYANAECWCICI